MVPERRLIHSFTRSLLSGPAVRWARGVDVFLLVQVCVRFLSVFSVMGRTGRTFLVPPKFVTVLFMSLQK